MHESYIIPGVVDGSVIKKQAEARAKDARDPDETWVHAHRYGEKCNEECYLVEKQDG